MLLLAVGNHEMDYPGMAWLPKWSGFGTDSGGECGVPYQKHFSMPLSSAGSSKNLWYSVDVGNVHMIVISTEHDFMEGSDQVRFAVVSSHAAVCVCVCVCVCV